MRQNNWMHRNLIVAGNFNLTNVNELFETLVDLGQHPKEKADTITVMEKIGHFLDDAVAKIYKKLKKEGFNKAEASPQIAERLNMKKVLRKASKKWDGGYTIAGLLASGSFSDGCLVCDALERAAATARSASFVFFLSSWHALP